eukprot:CAMPEP_0178427478 /NCGR_PEP_ID=MMETSP0689_2-20121128/29769_1 /TAXON_ID=160604 /ORGANISM="Amphidinium massartii, Strain CS-259" /LENGTH=298 /DNA_ID=CAMNT_0020049193 /DNA_START=98 /DNA_END=994 /DNA_ORIENTATION=-
MKREMSGPVSFTRTNSERDSTRSPMSHAASMCSDGEASPNGATRSFRLRADLVNNLSRPSSSCGIEGVKQHKRLIEAQKKNYATFGKHIQDQHSEDDLEKAQMSAELKAAKEEIAALRSQVKEVKRNLREEQQKTKSLTEALQECTEKYEKVCTENTLMKAGQSLQQVQWEQKQAVDREAEVRSPSKTPDASQQSRGLHRLRRVSHSALQSAEVENLGIKKTISQTTVSTTASVKTGGWSASLSEVGDDAGEHPRYEGKECRRTLPYYTEIDPAGSCSSNRPPGAARSGSIPRLVRQQ